MVYSVVVIRFEGNLWRCENASSDNGIMNDCNIGCIGCFHTIVQIHNIAESFTLVQYNVDGSKILRCPCQKLKVKEHQRDGFRVTTGSQRIHSRGQ